jgi:regulator of sigma E protease
MDPASMGKNLDKLSAAERKRAFHAHPVWQRFLIVLAGPAANFLLAIGIFAAFFAAVGAPNTPSIAAAVLPGSAAERAGIQLGDRIVALNGRGIGNFDDIANYTLIRPGEHVVIEVERAGRREALSATLDTAVEKDRFGQTYRIGRLGIANPQRAYEKVSAADLIPKAVKATADTTRSMITGLAQIITGRRSAAELHGPMKMAQIAGQVASLGFFEFVQLIALFSINLGFINLLPVPMLDGGHLALYAVEALRRRPLGERTQEWIFRGGLAALMTLLLFTTMNDLGSFGLWERIGQLLG